MKKVITLITLSLVMFMIGRLTTNSTEHVTNSNTEFTSYVMEGGYVESDVNYESEAVYIKKTFKPNMSISKIKHLLIYMDGLCKHYDVNYNLVKSVISTESTWDYTAKSRVNARGLMQIMKACAKDYKTPHSEMYDPYVNVTIGIKYLSKLNKRFEDTQTALVAYNEGPRHAERYKREYIDNSRYVHKVMTHFLTFEPMEGLAYND
tara:strand:- start:659 stop:1276 length:618 start_codon:yes stop_codon:yes gene_type:complete